MEYTIKPIAYIRTNLTGKFGLPRQSGVVPKLRGTIVFEPEYRDVNAVRGLEGFSHIWLIWQFSESVKTTEKGFSPTVRPPRLGGNERVGVFATRSPFRPNNLGLSSVKLESIKFDDDLGPVITVSGVDLMDGTPIFDIKPYIAYADSHPYATEGFLADASELALEVEFSHEMRDAFIAHTKSLGESEPEQLLEELTALLKNDPRPQYQDDPSRVYGLTFADADIKFTVDGNKLSVVDVIPVKVHD